jgi:hypothetical protein
MKKLMIAAAVAAMTVGAFASACSDPEEELANCYAWDVKMSLKSLQTKKTKCNIAAESECDDPTTDTVYYMDNVTRKLKGYLWQCEYSCDEFNVTLWDTKNKVAVIAYGAEPQVAPASDVVVYGKKATKVAGTITFEGVDALGEDGIAVVAAGINGKMVRGKADDDCYIKSLSGYASGSIAYIKPGSVTVTTKNSGSLCEDPTIEVTVCEEYYGKLIPFCEACCFEGWCDVDDWTDMVPATGTWSMKYNKKVAAGKKGSIVQLVPAYAL